MRMKPGKQFENFYWMEGPLEEDKGSRITVLHQGQEQQCSHCLRRGNCPGGGNGKACYSMNTPRGKIADYMKYLKISHNYLSLKMQFKQKQELDFPALGKKITEDDGFGHMVEEECLELDEVAAPIDQGDLLKGNILEVNPEDFEYDDVQDKMVPKDKEAFEKLVEMHPTVNKLKRDTNRDQKVSNLKEKVLATLKVNERRKRDWSCESVKSGCSGWGSGAAGNERSNSTDSRGRVRERSDDSDEESHQPKSDKQPRKSRSLLKPPKIILTQ